MLCLLRLLGLLSEASGVLGPPAAFWGFLKPFVVSWNLLCCPFFWQGAGIRAFASFWLFGRLPREKCCPFSGRVLKSGPLPVFGNFWAPALGGNAARFSGRVIRAFAFFRDFGHLRKGEVLPVFLAGRWNPGLCGFFVLFLGTCLGGECCPFFWQNAGIRAFFLSYFWVPASTSFFPTASHLDYSMQRIGKIYDFEQCAVF